MFRIKTRITEDIDELKNVNLSLFEKESNFFSGFVEVRIGEHKCGYYHENPMQDGEWGDEIINWWLEIFVEAANYIRKTQYAAFRIPETYNHWFEFKLHDRVVTINIARDVDKKLLQGNICTPFNDFIYEEPLDFKVGIDEFQTEIDNAVKIFIDQVEKINPELTKTKRILQLLELNNEVL